MTNTQDPSPSHPHLATEVGASTGGGAAMVRLVHRAAATSRCNPPRTLGNRIWVSTTRDARAKAGVSYCTVTDCCCACGCAAFVVRGKKKGGWPGESKKGRNGKWARGRWAEWEGRWPQSPRPSRRVLSSNPSSLDAGALAESLGEDAAGALGSGCLG